MRVFNTIKDAITYAREVLNASHKEAQDIRRQLEARSVAKFNGLLLFYDELHLLD
jgi:hypothetical protein